MSLYKIVALREPHHRRHESRCRRQETQQHPKKKNLPATENVDTNISISSFNPITKLQERIKKLQQITGTELETKPSKTTTTTIEIEKKTAENKYDPLSTRRSKTMGESLDEISNEIAWGFKHEMAKIGMALQHHIYKELIDEMVTDMAFSFSSTCFLPFECSSLPPYEACRRRLHF